MAKHWMAKHWSEVFSCRCGKRFRSYAAEAIHRHNYPMLCKSKKVRKPKNETQSPSSAPSAR